MVPIKGQGHTNVAQLKAKVTLILPIKDQGHTDGPH